MFLGHCDKKIKEISRNINDYMNVRLVASFTFLT